MNILNLKQKLKSEFVRNVAMLFSGTALAQLVPLVITPILTRLYTPSDYGVLAVFVAVTSLIAVASTLRYDIAILMPSDDRTAMAIMLLSILCVLIIAAIMVILIFITRSQIVQFIAMPSIVKWLYVMPLYVFFLGCSSALNYWLNRHKKFRNLAINRVAMAIVTAVATLAFGFYGFGYSGLILGIVIGQFATLLMLVTWTWRDVRDGLPRTSWELIRQSAKVYKKFPLFSLPSDFVNHLSQQLPALMMGRFFGAVVVGHFSFSQKILGAPLSLMSQSVCDVFKQRASSDYTKYGNCNHIFKSTFKSLTALSIIPLFLIFLLAPLIFKVVFGSEWEQAGQYTRYLVALYFFRFIVSPLSYVFFIANRQDADLIGQIVLLLVTIGSILLGAYLNNPDVAILSFSFGYAIVYGFYFLIARKLSCGKLLIMDNGRITK